MTANTTDYSATFEQNLRLHLSADWLRWIAENRLRNCTPASMIETMVGAGFDRALATHAVQHIDDDPVFQAFAPFIALKRKQDSMVSNLQKLRDSMPGQLQVERRSKLSRDEFIDRYVIPGRPVVITDLIDDWPARTRWTPDYLKERFGEIEVEVQTERNTDKRYEVNKMQLGKKMRLGDFVDLVRRGGETNDYYLTANNEALRDSRLSALLEDVGTLPPYCDASALASKCSIWFGPAGTITPLHHDTLMLLHSQMLGRKRWRFISPLQTHRLYNYMTYFSEIDLERPDLARFPDFADVNVLEVVAEPGETVFLPLSWWHQVKSLDMCISFSFSNLDLPNRYDYVNPEIPQWCDR